MTIKVKVGIVTALGVDHLPFIDEGRVFLPARSLKQNVLSAPYQARRARYYQCRDRRPHPSIRCTEQTIENGAKPVRQVQRRVDSKT